MNIANIYILKCYKILFSKIGLIHNIGFYIMIIVLLFHIICNIVFYINQFDKIKEKLKNSRKDNKETNQTMIINSEIKDKSKKGKESKIMKKRKKGKQSKKINKGKKGKNIFLGNNYIKNNDNSNIINLKDNIYEYNNTSNNNSGRNFIKSKSRNQNNQNNQKIQKLKIKVDNKMK